MGNQISAWEKFPMVLAPWCAATDVWPLLGGQRWGKDPGAVGSVHRGTAQLHSGIKALGYASVDLRQIEGQKPCSEDGFIWGQHTNATQGRQPRRATGKSPRSKRRRTLFIKEGKRKLGGCGKQRAPQFSLAGSFLAGKEEASSFFL